MADKRPNQANVNEAAAILGDKNSSNSDNYKYDLDYAKRVMQNATPEQKATARKELGIVTRSGGGSMRSYRGYGTARQG